jgi:hypothetical protein
MVSITLSLPEDVRELMRKFPEVNWSGLVRTCITEKAKKLALKEELLGSFEKEKEFNNWTVELGKEAKKGRLKRILSKKK